MPARPAALWFLFRLSLRLSTALVLVSGAARAATPPVSFAHETSDLKPDPAARFGKLDNGVRYVVYPNHEPKGRASLRLLVLAGSLQENENQRGVAHFLEHMAFNGSQHFAPGTLVEFFQRMGMNFGGDTNASTGFERTLYLLELPDTKTATLAEGLQVLADDAGGLLLKPEEIDKERGIILSEKRSRDTVASRTSQAQMDFMLGSTRVPSRVPIGLSKVIENAPRERFVEFWDLWYRPEKMAVIVAGDVDAAAVERQIADAFAALKARAPAPADPAMGAIARFNGVRAAFHREPEANVATIAVSCLSPYTPEPDSAALRVSRLPRRLAIAMLNRRLSSATRRENSPLTSARVSVTERFKIARDASLELAGKPERWAAALAMGEQELRRALEHGFQEQELRDAAANFLNSLEQADKAAATRRSAALAEGLAASILAETVYTSSADDLALLKPALEKLTPEACTVALREAFTANGRYVMVSGNLAIEGDAVAAIASAYASSRAVAVKPLAAPRAAGEWHYTDFGPPGQVAKREHIDDLDLTLVTFANGVRLNLKHTDFEANRISLLARVGNGTITEPAGQRGLATLAGSTFIAGGFGQHPSEDLNRILAGKNAGISFAPARDAFEFLYPPRPAAGRATPRGADGGGTTREDLLLTLQLLTAHLTDPGYRPAALRLAQRSFEQTYLGYEHTPAGPLSTEVARLVAGGDPRFGAPPKDVLMSRTLDEVRAWLAPQLAHGAIEIGIVGDLDVEATIDAVAKTLGALPPRDPKPDLAELRRVAFPAEPFTKDYTITSEIPKGAVVLYWPTTDSRDVQRSRRLTMLAGVLSDRLRVKIREEMAGTYSPRATSISTDTFPGYGYITTSIDVDPPTAAAIAEAALALADDLAKNGVTAEELTRARQPALTAAREALRTNSYWLNTVLTRAQETPRVLESARTRLSDLEAITAAELSALAKTYLGRERASRVTVLPAKAP